MKMSAFAILAVALVASAFLSACSTGSAGPTNALTETEEKTSNTNSPYAETGYDTGVIPEELERIPESYREPADHVGTLKKLEYQTYDSFNYGVAGHELQKTAWVYVPYGYDPAQRYDVFYLSHGGWSNETTLMGTDTAPTTFKYAIDHAIEDGLIRPVIMVMPTYNNLSPEDSGDYSLALQLTDNFHVELVTDLLPAVESKYSTYAEDVTPAGLKASRDHRAFGGFSMGGVNTWNVLANCLPYFRRFMPMSGGGLSGESLAQAAQEQGIGERDFFIFAITGTADFAHTGFSAGVMAMPQASSGFIELADSEAAGNLAYREREGYTHGPMAADEYTYNGMRLFFNGMHGVADAGNTTPLVGFEPYTTNTPISQVANDAALGDRGRLLFPADTSYMGGTTLGDISLTWYGTIDPHMTVGICNYVKGRALAGETVFIDIYSDKEIMADPAKADTGLFFFRGNVGAPTAIVNAGGGFSYVGAMHDSFPHALELSKRGYNAFALIYRPGAQTAYEDLARAIAYLHGHADELGISMEGYSLWGGSAGARMAARLGTHGTEGFGEAAFPRPAVCIVNYTGLAEVTGDEPPTYSAVGASDYIADWRTMRSRIERIRANGTPAEIEVFNGLGHGFGLGTGTAAEGWFDRAVTFWEENR